MNRVLDALDTQWKKGVDAIASGRLTREVLGCLDGVRKRRTAPK